MSDYQKISYIANQILKKHNEPKLKNKLEILQKERKRIKVNIEHFSNQLQKAQVDLSFKTEQMKDIEIELKR